MYHIKQTVSLCLMLALVSLGLTAQGQRRRTPQRSYYQIGDIITRVENASAQFNSSATAELNNGAVGNGQQQNADTYLSDYQRALQQLRARYNRRAVRTADVQLVLDRAMLLNTFVNRNQISANVVSDWASTRTELNELARAYSINWRPGTAAARRNQYPGDNQQYPVNNPPYNQSSGNQPYGVDAMLTGTFRLDTTQSDVARNQAEQATRTLPYRDRQRVLDNLMTRLEAPDALAIERRGRSVTIASSRAPQLTFEADGQQRTEQTANGRSIRATASIIGNRLTVSTTGDRGSDFNVTFDPADNGRRLFVTRRITDSNLSQPVVVRSVYTRTADVAQFDIYNGTQGYPTNTTGSNSTSSDSYIVPNNTTLVATLNNDLSTQNAKEGDRFTLTVRDQGQFDGATIEGTVGRVTRSGRATGRSEMALNLDTIRLRDGSSYRFAGTVESVRNPNGDVVRVDNEGTVRDDSQTTKTEQRAAIGTALGAIIGAIAGGGKGAILGGILGAGGGAGSVYAQGPNDLELRNGTEVSVRASAPNR